VAPLILLTLLSCPETKIVNYTNVWTKTDQSTLDGVKVRCGEIYKDAPCVKIFIKKEEQLYNVVCGDRSENGPSKYRYKRTEQPTK
jgi:hypothetical protein